MITTSQNHGRYSLSFTSGALLAREALIAAQLFNEVRDWNEVRDRLLADNLLQARTFSSGLRLTREVLKRLEVLNDSEIDLLLDASSSERGYLMWAAACRRYELIGDFAQEVIRERFLLLTPTLDHGNFDSFIRGKALWHPELLEIKVSTLRKLRSNVFRMLTEAGLLADYEIINAALSERLRNNLDAQTPSDLRFFPTLDVKEVTT